ncbi:MAG: transposase [Bacteroidales bacterium]|jgi:transposase|nr:transposase [Bacteroidales bacterium]
MAGSHGERGERFDVQAFFILLGARYKRIRKVSPRRSSMNTGMRKCKNLRGYKQKGVLPSSMLMRVTSVPKGMFPTGGSCLEKRFAYFPKELQGSISHYEGFTTTESITADKIVSFPDTFSLSVHKDTFVVLNNASTHRNHKIREMRTVREKRGLFLFYLPPYSPHLNIAETLWRILKGKWIRPQDYVSIDTLFYTTNSALGKGLFINYSHIAA